MANNIGTNPYLPPDIQLQQINVQRQQALADALRQQSLESTPNEIVSGRVVQKGLLGAIAPLLRAGLANKTQEGVTQAQGSLTKAYSDYLTQNANQMFPGSSPSAAQTPAMPQQPTGTTQDGQSVPTYSAPSGQPIGDAGGMSVPVTPNAQPAPQPAPQPTPQPTTGGAGPQLPPQLRAAYVNALRMGNQEGANKLLEMAWSSQMPTDLQKNNNYMGITGPQAGMYERGKLTKEGTQSLLPGQLNILPNNQRIVAPNFETGVAGGFDAQGNPVANEIPGSSQIAANRAGAVAGATEAGKLPYQAPTTINTPSGPALMTPAQSIAYANGGNNPNIAGDFRGDPKAAQASINQIPDPTERANAQAAFDKQTSGQNPAWSQPGAPLQTPAQADVEKAKGPAAVEAAKVKANLQPMYAAISDARKLVDALPSGAATPVSQWAANQPLIGDPKKAAAIAQWHNIMGNFTLSGIQGLNLGRMDIPIVKAIEKAGQVADDAAPSAKRAALDAIETAFRRHEAAVGNNLTNLNQQGTGAQPQAGMPKVIGGKSYVQDAQGNWFEQ